MAGGGVCPICMGAIHADKSDGTRTGWFGYGAGAGSSAPTRFKTSYASEARASPASGLGGRTAALSMYIQHSIYDHHSYNT